MCHIFRRDVLDHLLQLQNFQNQFLPNALRKLFCNISAPNNRGEYLSEMIDKFSDRFCHCNPKLGLDKGKDSMDIMIKWVFISYFVFFDLLWMKLVIDEGLILTPVRAGTHRVQIKSLVKGSEIHVSSFNVPYYGPIFFASFTSFHANIQYNYAKSCFFFHIIFNVYLMLYLHESLYDLYMFCSVCSLCFSFIWLKGSSALDT